MQTKSITSLMAVLLVACCTYAQTAFASDHDDGEIDLKGRSLNITDVFAFREDNQTGNPADSGNLILIMNTHPRALPGQQYFYSTQARYQIHLSQIAAGNISQTPTGSSDVVFRVQFGAPNNNGEQPVTLSFVKDGRTQVIDTTATNGEILTTNIGDSKAGTVRTNILNVDGRQVSLFAGPREDPFFFDVEQFFKVRSHAVENNAFLGFLPANEAKDFTHNYNVHSIVLRVPISLLQTSGETVFDVWTSISVPRS